MAGYGTDDGFQAYADTNGYDVPSGNVTAARNRGSIYIDGTYGDRFMGLPTGGLDQERTWPRIGVPGIADNVVPQRVINASYEAALLELREPGSLSVVTSGSARVVREKVGDLEVQYANPGGDALADATPIVTVIEGLLAPLLVKPIPGALVV
ncbi:hypothetical protein C7441_112180 [Pseudaminobacter salicylatoxidans]|uniref:Putative DnaT-like domain-containing protein n=1 Tax=Pseudaminobacter salicylatoxidans TaxID=93369 RepID=A0A316C196_PSESE|nr:DnaT-like ssDNA-binding protein [Pseudaminobacter salicylatoxidans]PWJ80638.1 hypothetical protein C7441_112180 [Pseudaminobacter salicylatoxidans]